MKDNKEYLMLREEIIHLDTIINNTVNFFYVFVAAALVYAINKDNSLFVLMTWVVIIPAYRIVLGKRKNITRIAAYLNVFHEGGEFNWERRQKRMYETTPYGKDKKVSSFNYPFIFVSTFVTIVFLMKIHWSEVGKTIEFAKIVIGTLLYIIQIASIIKNRKIDADKYVLQWEKIKKDEENK